MTEFTPTEGSRVRIDIPDETDPDHRLHGEHGQIVDTFEDDAGIETEDDRGSIIYRVQINSDETVDVRWRDLRPSFDE